MMKRLVTVSSLLAATVWTGIAGAYCRSTTCVEKALPDGGTTTCPKDAHHCSIVSDTSKPLFWAQTCVGYWLQQDLTNNLPTDETRAAIVKSFQAWSQFDCGEGNLASITLTEEQD